MQDTDTNAPVKAQTQPEPEPPLIEVGTYPEHFYQEARATFVIPKEPPRRSVRRSLFSPIGVVFISSLLMVALVSFSLGASAMASNAANAQSAAA